MLSIANYIFGARKKPMNNSSIKIRSIKIEDKDDWKTLFQMYADFYKV